MSQPRVRSVGPEIEILAGENIRLVREALGWTLDDLSFEIRDRTGKVLTVAVLRAIEDPEDDRRLVLGEAVVIAKALEVTVDSLAKEMNLT